jgi:hypothetical protein
MAESPGTAEVSKAEQLRVAIADGRHFAALLETAGYRESDDGSWGRVPVVAVGRTPEWRPHPLRPAPTASGGRPVDSGA